ncbi:MAG: hypothetical protein WA160_15560 [Pseudobdellovibrio sp.]
MNRFSLLLILLVSACSFSYADQKLDADSKTINVSGIAEVYFANISTTALFEKMDATESAKIIERLSSKNLTALSAVYISKKEGHIVVIAKLADDVPRLILTIDGKSYADVITDISKDLILTSNGKIVLRH